MPKKFLKRYQFQVLLVAHATLQYKDTGQTKTKASVKNVTNNRIQFYRSFKSYWTSNDLQEKDIKVCRVANLQVLNWQQELDFW